MYRRVDIQENSQDKLCWDLNIVEMLFQQKMIKGQFTTRY